MFVSCLNLKNPATFLSLFLCITFVAGCDVGSEEDPPPSQVPQENAKLQNKSNVDTLNTVPAKSDLYLSITAVNSNEFYSGYSNELVIAQLEQEKSHIVHLSWVAPDKNTTGSCLTDLTKYKIYFGKSSKSYTQSVDVYVDSPQLSCTSVDASRCGDVRECQFTVTVQL